jgi:hypothetical protein
LERVTLTVELDASQVAAELEYFWDKNPTTGESGYFFVDEEGHHGKAITKSEATELVLRRYGRAQGVLHSVA